MSFRRKRQHGEPKQRHVLGFARRRWLDFNDAISSSLRVNYHCSRCENSLVRLERLCWFPSLTFEHTRVVRGERSYAMNKTDVAVRGLKIDRPIAFEAQPQVRYVVIGHAWALFAYFFAR